MISTSVECARRHLDIDFLAGRVAVGGSRVYIFRNTDGERGWQKPIPTVTFCIVDVCTDHEMVFYFLFHFVIFVIAATLATAGGVDAEFNYG